MSKPITQAQIARAIGEPIAFAPDPDDVVAVAGAGGPDCGPPRPQARRVIARDADTGRQQLSGHAAALNHGYPPVKAPLLAAAGRRAAARANHPSTDRYYYTLSAVGPDGAPADAVLTGVRCA